MNEGLSIEWVRFFIILSWILGYITAMFIYRKP